MAASRALLHRGLSCSLATTRRPSWLPRTARCKSSGKVEVGLPEFWSDLQAQVTNTVEAVAKTTTDNASNGLKPVFDQSGSPFRTVFETGRLTANSVLKAVDAPVRFDFVPQEEETHYLHDDDRAHISTWCRPTCVPNADIETYVDVVLNAPGNIVNNPWIPDVLERRLYMLVVKMVLQGVHFGCGAIDERVLFGQTLRLVQRRSGRPLRRADILLTHETFENIIEQVMLNSTDSTIISKSVDELVYQNTIRFAIRLVIDMACSLQLTTFGLKFSVIVEPDDKSSLKHDTRTPMDVVALEKACEPIIRELLADEDINIAILPDQLEEQLYKNVMRLLANVAAAAADNSEIDLFGIRIVPDVV